MFSFILNTVKFNQQATDFSFPLKNVNDFQNRNKLFE